MRRQLLSDLLDEAVASAASRPGRLVLTMLGPALGITAMIATLGLAATAGNHIVTRFDALAATEVVVVPHDPTGAAQGGAGPVENRLQWDGGDRLERLNGVRAAGALTEIELDPSSIRAVAGDTSRTASRATLQGGSVGLLAAVRGRLAEGRWFDLGHVARGDRVAIVGQSLAEQIGVANLRRRPAVLVGDEAYAVIGVLEHVERQPQLLSAVIVTEAAARELYGIEHPDAIHVDTDVGAAGLVAEQTPYALSPAEPDLVEAQRPREPAATRAKVDDDTQALFLLLGGLSLIVGGLGIANTTFVAVLERRAEIGLRRSVGATRGHIAAQFLLEATGMGFLGGITGAALGTVLIVSIAAANDWTPVLAPWLPPAGAGLGAGIGLLAGCYPSLRAASLQPIEVLRG